MSNAEIIARNQAHELGVYARFPVAFVRGQGCELWDADGKRYLDFFAGLSVNNLGHCHPAVVEAIRAQVGTLMHVSNLYHSSPVGEIAELLCKHSFAERVFFCNSGAEANEAAMKLARRWGNADGGGRYEILATTGSFHGRTVGTLTATGQEKYHQGFLPLLPGVRLIPFDDVRAFEAAIRPETVAIIVEPIQGEGGVVVPGPGYLRGLREVCDAHGLLLILDEIQTGLGRTGKLFAHQYAGITPDIMTLAKALGGGVPIGAMCTTETIAKVMTPGSHGTTFGGNLVACAAATAAVRVIAEPAFLEGVAAVGAHFRAGLDRLATKHARVRHVRGVGMMAALVLDGPGADVAKRCLDAGLLINCTADRVLRFLPPLVLTTAQADEGMAILDEALAR
jgi:acetylornithine aminotransferase